ncbi:YcxB family protein [Bacteroides sp.]|uniref:YcxB family protein n=1 Tax=Bacteroides sp. TaxID=29523 RepID=UPI0026171229|nr:YcxB family protein [Bacteroides sp.]MDD3039326.1 YcxB family protein [Bacteroides sp.]
MIAGIWLSGESIIYPSTVIILSFLIYYNWKATKGMDLKAAKAFDLNKVNKDLETQICFFNDHYETTDEKGCSNIPYSNLYKIIETDTNLYLMYCKNQGVIIVKSNCSTDLIEFVHSIKSEYKL